MNRSVASLLLLMLAALPASQQAEAKTRTIEGTILRFECGDNCYLTIRDTRRQERTGLCAASQCDSWNANVEMPERFVGRRVSVTVGTGTQVDGSGNVMGETMSFDALRFLDGKR